MEKAENKVISVEILAVFVEIIINSVENIVICVVTFPNSGVNTGPKCSDERELSFIGKKNCPENIFWTTKSHFLFKSKFFNCFFIKSFDDFNDQFNCVLVVITVKHRCV